MPKYGDTWLDKDNRPYTIIRLYDATDPTKYVEHPVLIRIGATGSGFNKSILNALHWLEVGGSNLTVGVENKVVFSYSGGVIMLQARNSTGKITDIVSRPSLGGFDNIQTYIEKGFIGGDVLTDNGLILTINYATRTVEIQVK